MKLTLKYILFALLTSFVMNSCQQPGGESTGSEFMPDMVHSTAYEANLYTYYSYNTWGTEDEYHKFAQPRLPVAGTIARGAAGSGNHVETNNAINYRGSGSVPYYYEDTEAERERAIAEIIDNPFPITDKGLAQAKELYIINCGICHGDKGDGDGYLVRDANPATGDAGGVYPVQPANFLLEEFVTASNGRYYHSIMHGKNLMGAYNDKLSYEERWQVIHYIRSLQAKELKLAYNQTENTLNSVDKPAGKQDVLNLSEAFTSEAEGDHRDEGQEGH